MVGDATPTRLPWLVEALLESVSPPAPPPWQLPEAQPRRLKISTMSAPNAGLTLMVRVPPPVFPVSPPVSGAVGLSLPPQAARKAQSRSARKFFERNPALDVPPPKHCDS